MECRQGIDEVEQRGSHRLSHDIYLLTRGAFGTLIGIFVLLIGGIGALIGITMAPLPKRDAVPESLVEHE